MSYRLQTTISDTMFQTLNDRAWDTSMTINELVRLAIVNSYVAPVFVAPSKTGLALETIYDDAHDDS